MSDNAHSSIRYWAAKIVAIAGAGIVFLSGCTPPPEPPPPSPSGSASELPRPFTILTSGPPFSADPVLADGETDSLIVTNVFQRLMRIDPATGELKPDAALDCLYKSRTKYQCQLAKKLRFHDGSFVTAADVKFSIQRALRLGRLSAGVSQLESLKRIDITASDIVTFVLKQPDNHFGYALTSPAASIVKMDAFNPDATLTFEKLPVGSGPYLVTSINADGVSFARYHDYLGPVGGSIEEILLTVVADSATAETALKTAEADAVWGTLTEAASSRILGSSTPEKSPKYYRFNLPGARVIRLLWNPFSKNRDNQNLRDAIAQALEQDRTLDSIVPVGIVGYTAEFSMGKQVLLPQIKGKRLKLTLGYDHTRPDMADLALVLRDRIEALDSVSVRVTTSRDSDLWLSDERPATSTTAGWLEPYLDYPLPAIAEILDSYKISWVDNSDKDSQLALENILRQTAIDNTVLPISQSDGIFIIREGVNMHGGAFGSAGELGLGGLHLV